MVCAPVAVHPVIVFAAVLCIAVGAGAAGALNMWWDSDIDAVMARTAGRPIPSGRVERGEALAIGLTLARLLGGDARALRQPRRGRRCSPSPSSSTRSSTRSWLKRATPQNIVIGGAAGAFPPMIGWAVATGGIAPESVAMFALIFLWTPPHFWALALFRNDDYARAGVPMLPVTAGAAVDPQPHPRLRARPRRRRDRARVQRHRRAGLPRRGAGAERALRPAAPGRVWRRDEAAAAADRFRVEKRFFGFSILYMTLHFALLLAEAVLRALAPDPGRLADAVLRAARCGPTATKSTRAAAAATAGLGLTLGAFVLLIFAVTIVKLSQGEDMRGYDHTYESLPPPAEALSMARRGQPRAPRARARRRGARSWSAASFAAVPFYTWFCRVTGYGGTTSVADARRRRGRSTGWSPSRFDANTAPGHALGVPPEAAGDDAAASARPASPSTRPTTRPTSRSPGRRASTSCPSRSARYFDKIACFCFEHAGAAAGRAGGHAGQLLRRPGDARRPRVARRDRDHALLYDVPDRPARSGGVVRRRGHEAGGGAGRRATRRSNK